MNAILSLFLGNFFNVWIDDVVTYYKSLAKRRHHFICVLEVLKRAVLKMNVQKNEFYQSKVVLLE